MHWLNNAVSSAYSNRYLSLTKLVKICKICYRQRAADGFCFGFKPAAQKKENLHPLVILTFSGPLGFIWE